MALNYIKFSLANNQQEKKNAMEAHMVFYNICLRIFKIKK